MVEETLISRRYGRVINVSSTLGLVAIENRAAYAACKGVVIQFSKVLTLEWAPHNITVNALCPGAFLTEFNRSIINDKEAYQKSRQGIPPGRFGDPDELAGTAISLASRTSSYMTGTTVFVDGGRTAK